MQHMFLRCQKQKQNFYIISGEKVKIKNFSSKMSLIRQILTKAPPRIQWAKASAPILCRNSSSMRDAPIIDPSTALANPEEIKQKNKLQTKITVPVQVNLSPISGVPEEHLRERRVRIHLPPKNAMQSGTDNINHWQIEFDNRERWENPLMGWASTGDPLSNMQVNFNSKEEAITYCERNGWRWFVEADAKPKKDRVKNYGINFSWNKRTRVSTK